MEEKRTSTRVQTNIEIVFREAWAFVRSYMLNVSNGGLFIKTEHSLPFDAVIMLRMQLPDERGKMTIQCRVVWINTVAKSFPSGMVVQFLYQDSEGQKKITVFVDDNREQIKQREIL